MKTVWLFNLGTVPYADPLTLQHRHVAARKRGALNDTLLLLEHPPVFTLGRKANDSNIITSPEFLKQLGIDVCRVERGGDVTYHGPGQLVGYPILNLRNFRMDVGWFVRSLEETIIRTLGDFGITGKRVEKLIARGAPARQERAPPPPGAPNERSVAAAPRVWFPPRRVAFAPLRPPAASSAGARRAPLPAL